MKELTKREKNLLLILLRAEFDTNRFGVILRDEELDKRIVSIVEKLELCPKEEFINDLM